MTTALPAALHPRFCSPQLCRDTGSDIEHREVPEMFGASRGLEAVTVGLTQWDERDGEDRQIVHDVEVELALVVESSSGRAVHLTPDETDALARLLHASAERARRRESRPGGGG